MKEASFRCARICKALGNPLAFQLLEAIAKKPSVPSELAKMVRRSMPGVSHQLKNLRLADLVRYSTKGTYVLYRVKYLKETLEILEGLEGLVRLNSEHKGQDSNK